MISSFCSATRSAFCRARVLSLSHSQAQSGAFHQRAYLSTPARATDAVESEQYGRLQARTAEIRENLKAAFPERPALAGVHMLPAGQLPTIRTPAGNYLPTRETSSSSDDPRLIYVSGQVPIDIDRKPLGEPGAEDTYILRGAVSSRSLEHAVAAARLCGVNIIAQLNRVLLGHLGCVRRIVKVEGFVNTGSVLLSTGAFGAPEPFRDHPKVINGCSDLMCEVFGQDVGAHARFAVGCASLPLDVTVEIGGLVEVEPEAVVRALEALESRAETGS